MNLWVKHSSAKTKQATTLPPKWYEKSPQRTLKTKAKSSSLSKLVTVNMTKSCHTTKFLTTSKSNKTMTLTINVGHSPRYLITKDPSPVHTKTTKDQHTTSSLNGTTVHRPMNPWISWSKMIQLPLPSTHRKTTSFRHHRGNDAVRPSTRILPWNVWSTRQPQNLQPPTTNSVFRYHAMSRKHMP